MYIVQTPNSSHIAIFADKTRSGRRVYSVYKNQNTHIPNAKLNPQVAAPMQTATGRTRKHQTQV